MTTPANINGRVILGSSTAQWSFVEGIAPHTETFDLRPEDAKTLLQGRAQSVTLTLGDQTIDRLYVVSEVPGPNEHIARVLVADRRYWWPYIHVLRRYNVRRRVGVKVLSGDDLPDELKPIVEDTWYAPWSTRDGDGKIPWTADEVAEDVLERVLTREEELNGQGKNYRIDTLSFGSLQNVEIEDLEIDSDGASAVGSMLQYLPEASVTVNRKGEVVVYSRVSGDEVIPIQQSGPEAMDRGHVRFIEHHRTRPSSIRVFFSRECELRFDFAEKGPGETASAEKKDDRFLDNVLDVPDFSLTIPAQPGRNEKERTVSRGTWIPIADALDAWSNLGGIPGWGDIELSYIRRAMVPFWDLWAAPRLRAETDPDNDWLARFNAIEEHYRQTYRINRRWMDRIHSVRAYRVGIIDSESGTRAPAVAFSNYARVGTSRSILADGYYIKNVVGYPPAGVLDGTEKPTPARVSVLDSDQGIVRLDYLADVVKKYNITLPSIVTNAQSGNAGATQKLRRADYEPITFDSLPDGRKGNYPQFSSSHNVIVILTALAGSPNDSRQLHMIEVGPNDIADMLPPLCRNGLSNANGPALDIRIGATPQTVAMVKWDDAWKSKIEAAFGLSGHVDDDIDLTQITTNAGFPGAMLDAIAYAVAAGAYASYSDRYQGMKTVKLKAGFELAGWLGEVAYSVDTDGEASTRLTLREGGPSMDLMPLLPKNVRANMMRLAQPGGQA